MATQKLNVIHVLRNDTLSEWNGSGSVILQEGEIALAQVGSTQVQKSDGTYYQEPVYMAKIGDGSSSFSSLNWLAAPASDVLSWAKKASFLEAYNTATDNTLTGAKLKAGTIDGAKLIDRSVSLGKLAVDVATQAELDAAITTLETSINSVSTNTYTKTEVNSKVSQLNSDIQAVEEIANTADEKADTNAEAIEAIEAEIVTLKATDANNLAEAKAYTDTKATETMTAVENKGYATKTEAQSYANAKDAAIQQAQDTADAAKASIDAFLDENAATDDVVNTLKEIQAGLDAGEASAASLLSELNKIKDGTTTVPNATNADTVDGKHASEFATSAQGLLADNSVQKGKVTGDITINENGEATIADSAITEGKINTGAVTTTKLADGAVTTAKIASKAVTREKIDDYAVGTDQIGLGAVTEEKIGDLAVTEGKIAANSVSEMKLTQAIRDKFYTYDTAVQTVTATGENGITATATKTGTTVAIKAGIDTTVTFILDGGTATA